MEERYAANMINRNVITFTASVSIRVNDLNRISKKRNPRRKIGVLFMEPECDAFTIGMESKLIKL